MLSTHLPCQNCSIQETQENIVEDYNNINLHELTSFLQNCLPNDYPQPTKFGYSKELNEELSLQLFCGVRIGCYNSQIPRLFIESNNHHDLFPVQCYYDIDSFIGKAKSLSVAKHGIRFQVCPNPLHNITKNIHLYTPVPERLLSGKIKYHQIPIHQIPHFRLGTIFSTFHIPIYVFLPGLYNIHSSTNTYLTNHNIQQWMDIGFLPSVHQHYSSDVLQHLPSSFESA
ncbi:hypothetical protein L873DRAFT_1468607, partial [Choiromyces venosus 120613-1]